MFLDTPDSSSAGESASRHYVLLAEDEVSIRSAFARLLRREHGRVVEAIDGEDALRVVAREDGQPVVLVTDLVMPGMGGKELVKRLRSTMPELPVVMMSGYPQDEGLREELGAGRLVFLQKPFGIDVLLSAVRESVRPARPGA